MNRDRLWGLAWIAAVAAVVVLGTMLGIVPKAEEAKAASRELATVEAQNVEHELALAALQDQYASIDDLKDDLADLQLGIPLAADIPAFVAELSAIATQYQVTIEQISIADGTGYVPTEPVVATDTAATDTAATDTTATDAAATAATGIDANSRVTAATYISIPVSIEATGTGSAVLEFLSGLQYGDRIIAINSFATDAAVTADVVTVSIEAEIYVLVDPTATTAE